MLKTIFKKITPPLFIDLYGKYKYREGNFVKWWKKVRNDKRLPDDLVRMTDYFVENPSFNDTSKYWSHNLNKKHIKKILNDGYGNFRQTVSRKYFTWVGWRRSYLFDNLVKNSKMSVPLKEIMRKHSQFSLEESVSYNLYTALLFEHVKDIGGLELYKKIEEPAVGNTAFITLENKKISQDILSSIIEIMSISQGCDLNKISSVLEIGAGYGRTAFCLLKIFPNIKYIIADIPPALYISQTYLEHCFKDRKIFKFRPFKYFDEIKEEFSESKIIFLTPDQLNFLPHKEVDLFLAIDCLHEMKREQIEKYFNLADKIAKFFYFKCWIESLMPVDKLYYTKKDYPVKDNWVEIFNRDTPSLSAYFEAFYKLK